MFNANPWQKCEFQRVSDLVAEFQHSLASRMDPATSALSSRQFRLQHRFGNLVNDVARHCSPLAFWAGNSSAWQCKRNIRAWNGDMLLDTKGANNGNNSIHSNKNNTNNNSMNSNNCKRALCTWCHTMQYSLAPNGLRPPTLATSPFGAGTSWSRAGSSKGSARIAVEKFWLAAEAVPTRLMTAPGQATLCWHKAQHLQCRI